MDINTLIEQGKARIAERKLQEQLAHEERERVHQAELDAEMRKFVAEAIEPLRAACDRIGIGDLSELNGYKWQMSVPLSALLCTTIRAEFELLPPWPNAPRSDRIWKLKRYLVPRVELDKGADECDEPWLARESFWARGYLEATEVKELDEALALASERFVEFLLLGQEANDHNEAMKAERAQRAEMETRRIQAEQTAFKPFTYYCVYYAAVAGDDEEHYVDIQHFHSLHDGPSMDGYWLSAQGDEFRVEHLVKVEREYVSEVAEMPDWCPTVETEFGFIRVPSGGAETEGAGTAPVQ